MVTISFKLANEAGLVELSGSEQDGKFMFADKDVLNDEIRNEVVEIFDKIWDDIMENSDDPNESVGTYADIKFDLLKQK